MLARPKLERWAGEGRGQAYVEAFAARSEEHVDPPRSSSEGVRDPDDDYLVDLTRASGAEILVSARTNLPEAVSSLTYNDANELTGREGTSLSYDEDGNLTNDGTSAYTYNDRNQLTELTQGSNTWSFAYDPFGRRTTKTKNTVATDYLYDEGNVATETSEGKTASLLNGLGLDERYARTTSSYLTDQLGSTIALADSSGEPTTEYTYDPFGATTSTGATSTNPYQYTGRENDSTGLQYNRARYYSPTTGRFTSQDPLGLEGSGTNLYAYTGDNPLNGDDPSGMSSTISHEMSILGHENEAEEKRIAELEHGTSPKGGCKEGKYGNGVGFGAPTPDSSPGGASGSSGSGLPEFEEVPGPKHNEECNTQPPKGNTLPPLGVK